MGIRKLVDICCVCVSHAFIGTFDTFVLPEQLSLPVGLAVDNNGNLWATDYRTISYTLDIKSRNVTRQHPMPSQRYTV
jgi:hypothetical protein